MAANRDEHSLETLVKTNQAIIRIDIALLRMSPVVRIVHLKGHIFDGFFTCHCSLSLLPTCSIPGTSNWPHCVLCMLLDLRQLDFGALFPVVRRKTSGYCL